jgi:putative ABC transport system ATP-binding protein
MLFAARQLTKRYQGRAEEVLALDHVSLSVDAGRFLAVVGPSGCGKSTLLLIAGGLLAPDSGQIEIAGTDPYTLSNEQRARFRAVNVGFVFQQFHLVPYLTVLENVLVPTLAIPTAKAPARADELLARFGLQDRREHLPSELSSGERQRTALARALLNQPKLILADEPTGNLDRENADAVLKYLSEFTREGGAVLLVTHDPEAVRHADEVAHIERGRMAAA